MPASGVVRTAHDTGRPLRYEIPASQIGPCRLEIEKRQLTGQRDNTIGLGLADYTFIPFANGKRPERRCSPFPE